MIRSHPTEDQQKSGNDHRNSGGGIRLKGRYREGLRLAYPGASATPHPAALAGPAALRFSGYCHQPRRGKGVGPALTASAMRENLDLSSSFLQEPPDSPYDHDSSDQPQRPCRGGVWRVRPRTVVDSLGFQNVDVQQAVGVCWWPIPAHCLPIEAFWSRNTTEGPRRGVRNPPEGT